MSRSPNQQVAGAAGGDCRFWFSYLGMSALGLLLLAYVFSAPLLHDSHGFPLRFQMPVWDAARSGPFSFMLKPYFRLCGVDFPAPRPEPPRESYE